MRTAAIFLMTLLWSQSAMCDEKYELYYGKVLIDEQELFDAEIRIHTLTGSGSSGPPTTPGHACVHSTSYDGNLRLFLLSGGEPSGDSEELGFMVVVKPSGQEAEIFFRVEAGSKVSPQVQGHVSKKDGKTYLLLLQKSRWEISRLKK